MSCGACSQERSATWPTSCAWPPLVRPASARPRHPGHGRPRPRSGPARSGRTGRTALDGELARQPGAASGAAESQAQLGLEGAGVVGARCRVTMPAWMGRCAADQVRRPYVLCVVRSARCLSVLVVRVLYGPAAVSRLFRSALDVSDTVAADRVLEARGILEVLQDEVDRAKLPRFFRDFALTEAEVVSRFSYDPLLVPGLLQTEAYARAVFAAHCPPLSEEIIDQHTEARLNRQKLLTRVPLAELSFIISEEALRNPVGDAEVMRDQWQRLLDVGALRNIEVQVMPTSPGFHTGLNGPFVVLETDEHRHLGYVEAQEVGCVVRDPAEASAFGLRYGKLRSQALNPVESARLIGRLVGEA